MIHFPRPGAAGRRGDRGRGGGRAGRRVPWPGRAFPVAARPGPASGALFSCPPGPPPRPNLPAAGRSASFPRRLQGGRAAARRARCPRAPPSGLRASRQLDPRRAALGSEEQPRSPPPAAHRPPAGWPLSHRFHRSRLRFPAPSPSLPSLMLGTVQLALAPEPGSAQPREGPLLPAPSPQLPQPRTGACLLGGSPGLQGCPPNSPAVGWPWAGPLLPSA